jgi:hypothetical protein
MLSLDPLAAVAPLAAAAALAAGTAARRFSALGAAVFALGSAGLAAALSLPHAAGELARIPLLSLRIDAGLEALGLALALAGAAHAWRQRARAGSGAAAILALAGAILMLATAAPHWRAAIGAA